MTTFDRAVAFTLDKEGVLSNDANDRGGITKYGIIAPTLRAYQNKTGKLAGRTIPSLTRDEAIAIYRALYWRYDGIVNDRVAIKLFDYGVNVGLTQAVLFAQRALLSLGVLVTADGLYGPATQAAINEAVARKGPVSFMNAMLYHAAKFYVGLVDVNKTQLDFIAGWLSRAVARP